VNPAFLTPNGPSNQGPLGRPTETPVQQSPQKLQAAVTEEETLRGETVASRARPDFDPLGLRVGSFLFYPDLDLEEAFNNNIFATQHRQKSDLITAISPALDLKSNWDQHALNFHASSTSLVYADHSSENINDFAFGTDGRLDIRHDARAYGGLAVKRLHVPRESPDNTGGTSPTAYTDYAGSIAGEKEFNRLSFRLDGNYDRYDYENDTTSTGIPIA
jgi:hypothetical protein